jgi:hypothetical protein
VTRRLISAAAVLGSTVAWLALFFAIRPFHHVRDALDRAFGALPAWTQVDDKDMEEDPLNAELSRGETPIESFRILAGFWAKHPGAERIILMGNSQSLMTSLAPGEPPATGHERTYTDLIAGHFRNSGSKKLFYRLSAGALSYEEMLWYAAYLAGKPEVKPDVLLVQLNYQNFMNAGIRDGMQELLSDPAFHSRIEEIVRDHGPDSFDQALQKYASPLDTATKGGEAAAHSPGDRIETAVREKLERIPAIANRSLMYTSFLEVLIRIRTYFTNFGTMKRSLKGSRVDTSRAALERIAQLCAASGIRMVLFQAPTNPALPLYATSEDDSDYHSFAASLASRYGLKIFDFEHTIPGRYWGMALNVPDPLHLGREGHRLLAGQMIAAMEQNGI